MKVLRQPLEVHGAEPEPTRPLTRPPGPLAQHARPAGADAVKT